MSAQVTQPTGVEARICALIAERQQLGIKKYGKTVADTPLPLRDWLVHSLLEKLDDVIYMQRAIDEIDATAKDQDDGAAERISDTQYIYRGSLREVGIGSTWQEAQQDYFRRNK